MGMQAFPQVVEAYSKLDTSSIMIGDQIGLEVGITVPESFFVSMPFFKDTISTNIEIIKKEPIDTTEIQEGILFTQKYTITSFDSGYFELPDFKFLFHHKDDTTVYRTSANTLFLMVNTPLVDTSQAIKAIKGPARVPYTFAEIFPWVLLGLGVAAIVVFLIWYIRRRRNNKPVFVRKPKPPLPPDVLALQKLEELRLAKIWQQGRLKMYYTNLADIVREYFEGRYHFDAMEMTTDEILDALKDYQLNKEVADKLRNALQLADLVKFAKAHPTPLENDLCLNHCIDLVNETKPIPLPQSEEKPELVVKTKQT